MPGRNFIPSGLLGGCRDFLERLPEFSGRFQGAPDIVVFGTRVERNELKTVRTLPLKAVAHPLRAFSKHHRALAALYFDLVVNHGYAPTFRFVIYCSEVLMSVKLTRARYGKQAVAEIGIVRVLYPTFIE